MDYLTDDYSLISALCAIMIDDDENEEDQQENDDQKGEN